MRTNDLAHPTLYRSAVARVDQHRGRAVSARSVCARGHGKDKIEEGHAERRRKLRLERRHVARSSREEVVHLDLRDEFDDVESRDVVLTGERLAPEQPLGPDVPGRSWQRDDEAPRVE